MCVQLSIEDLYITILQECPDRPLPLSVNLLKCSRLRKQWLLFDLLSADAIVGSFDSCLFNVSTPQRTVAGMRATEDTRVVRCSVCCPGLPLRLFQSVLGFNAVLLALLWSIIL